MKKVSIFILTALLTMFVNTNSVSAAAVSAGVVKYKPISDRVRAVNEDGEYLPGTFVLKTLDNRILANYIQVDCSKWKSTGIGCNEIDTMIDNNNRLDKAIEDAILDDFASIKTVEEAAQKLNVPCETDNISGASADANKKYIVSKLIAKDNSHTILLTEKRTNYCDSIHVYKDIYYPMIVEQLTAEKGYAKGPRLIALIKAEINISDTKATASRKNVYLYNDVLDGYYTYDQEYDYANMYSLTDDEIAQFKSEYYVGLINEGEDFHTVPNSIAMPKLEIENYINDGPKTTIKKGEQANYKVVIKNTGNTEYTNNVITSTIPYELNYVTGSASNNGTYNANKRTITWNIDLLDPGSTKELSYKLEANKDITDVKELELSSTIKNSENPNGIVTESVTIKTSKNIIPVVTSPKTGALLSIIMLTLSLLITGFLTINYFRKKQNS